MTSHEIFDYMTAFEEDVTEERREYEILCNEDEEEAEAQAEKDKMKRSRRQRKSGNDRWSR